MIQKENLVVNEIDNELVSDLISKIKKKELISKLQQQFQSKEIIYGKLLKIIKASAILENFEVLAGKAMLILRKMFKIIKNENFSRIRLQDSSLEGMCFVNCNFQKSQIQNVKLVACKFVTCCFNNVNWENMISVEQTFFKGYNSQIKILVVSSDETMLATCAIDNTIQLWDLKTYEKIKRLRMSSSIYQAGFYSNKFLVVRFSTHTQVLNISSEKPIQKYKTYGSCCDQHNQLLFNGLMIDYINPKLQTIYIFSIKKGKFCVNILPVSRYYNQIKHFIVHRAC